jgi:hypothetical protein
MAMKNKLFVVLAIIALVGFVLSLDYRRVWAQQDERSEEERAARLRTQKGIELTCPGACPIWSIYLDDYGYSDYLWYKHHGLHGHEMLSGEWAAAILYDGIDTPGGKAMWLPHNFVCPSWTTNSNFQVVQSMQSTGMPNQVSSIIANSKVQIEIIATMYCSQTQMGIWSQPPPEKQRSIVSDNHKHH